MPTQIDQQLQRDARDAIEALGDVASLTASTAFQAALTELIERVTSVRTDHQNAVTASERDADQNRLAALTFDEAAAQAVGVYRHLRARAKLELVDLDPLEAAELGAIEVERRQRVFDQAFHRAPSELAELGRLNVKAALQSTLDQLDGTDSGLTRASRKRLADMVAELERGHTQVRDEARDDAQLADRLFTTRDALSRLTQALLDTADALLRADNSPQTLDRLLQTSRKRRTEPHPQPPVLAPTPDTPPPGAPTTPEPVE